MTRLVSSSSSCRGRLQLLLDAGARLAHGEAAHVRVEIVRRLDERRRRQPLRQVDDAVLDGLVLADEDDQRLARLQLHELDVLEARHLLVGQHDAGAVRQAGDHLADLAQHVVDGGGALAGDVRLDLPAVLAGEIADLEQAVDEQPQTELRRQATGRSMRRHDQPELLQVRHDVADRGGRQRHRQHARQVARPDRLTGFEVGLDDLP